MLLLLLVIFVNIVKRISFFLLLLIITCYIVCRRLELFEFQSDQIVGWLLNASRQLCQSNVYNWLGLDSVSFEIIYCS